MKIYFAGSISGGRQDAAIYKQIIDLLSEDYQVLTEHIGDHELDHLGERLAPSVVYGRDRAWVEESDIIVAEVTVTSLGVGYELGLAESLKKPVICLFRTNGPHRLSPMISGNQYFQILEYTNIEQLRDTLVNRLRSAQ